MEILCLPIMATIFFPKTSRSIVRVRRQERRKRLRLILGKQAQKKKRKVPKAENEKLSSAPASAEAAARAGKSRNETIGKDIAGTRGAGGADKDAQGQFISGKGGEETSDRLGRLSARMALPMAQLATTPATRGAK